MVCVMRDVWMLERSEPECCLRPCITSGLPGGGASGDAAAPAMSHHACHAYFACDSPPRLPCPVKRRRARPALPACLTAHLTFFAMPPVASVGDASIWTPDALQLPSSFTSMSWSSIAPGSSGGRSYTPRTLVCVCVGVKVWGSAVN
eukprot:362555-Chlamydomonas_euryale.AAC.1